MILNLAAFLIGSIFLLLPLLVITDFHTGQTTEILVMRKRDYWLLVGVIAGFCWGITCLCLLIIDEVSFKPNFIVYHKSDFSVLESVVFLIKATILGATSGLLLGLFLSFLDRRRLTKRNKTVSKI